MCQFSPTVPEMKRDRYSKDELRLRKILRDGRVSSGLSQSDLAAKLSVHQSFVSKYESGERLLTFTETLEICEAIKLPAAELIRDILNLDES